MIHCLNWSIDLFNWFCLNCGNVSRQTHCVMSLKVIFEFCFQMRFIHVNIFYWTSFCNLNSCIFIYAYFILILIQFVILTTWRYSWICCCCALANSFNYLLYQSNLSVLFFSFIHHSFSRWMFSLKTIWYFISFIFVC